MSTTVTVFSFILNAIKSIISSTISFVKSTTFNTRVFQLGIGMASATLLCILILVVGINIIKEVSGYGVSQLDRIKRRRSGKSALAKADMESLFLSMGTIVVTTGLTATTILSTFLTIMLSSILIWISMLFVVGIGFVFLTYSDTIMSTVLRGYIAIWNPLMTMVTIAGASVIISVELLYPIYTAIMKLIHGLPRKMIQLAIVCVSELLPEVIRLSFNIVFSFIVNLTKWITMNPLYTELPMLNTIQYITELVSTVGTTVVECACHVLRYIIGGIMRALENPSLSYAILNAINLVWVLAMQVVVIPTLSLFTLAVGAEFIWPSFSRSFDLYIGVLDNVGFFVQNATVITMDIWICGGNGTLVGMVDGSIPMPVDDYQYLVRALQAQWARGVLRGANLFTLQVVWQLASFFQGIPYAAYENGNELMWNINWTYNEGIFVTNAFGTLVAMAGECDVNNYPMTPFAQLSTIFRAAVRAIRVIWDIVWGEIYFFVFNLTFPGIYADSYLQISPIYAGYTEDIIYAGIAYGCLLAFIDIYLGIALQGVVETILIYAFQIPAQFITRIRAIFGGTSANVLDDIAVDDMEVALIKIAQLGGFFFQFEPGANEVTCLTRLTLLCNLGMAITLTLTVVARLVATAVAIVVEFIKFITGSIQMNAVQLIQIPRDIACDPTLSAGVAQITGSNCKMILVEDIYSAGCRIGVVVGNILPIDVPCMSGADNFCIVNEFPDVRPNTFTKCASTFMCKFGRLIAVPFDFFFTIFNWVVNFKWDSSQGTNADNDFLVNIFRKVMYLVVWGLLGPLCPFAHVLDCIWSLILRAGGGDGKDTPASNQLCLITAFMVVFVRDVGDLIIMIIRIVVFFASLIFGTASVANSTAEIGQLLTDFFTVFGETIKKILMLFLTMALQGLFNMLSSICELIADIADFFDAPPVDCTPLSNALSSILAALGVTPIDAPINSNYKREAMAAEDTTRATAMENTVNQQQQQQQDAPKRKCTPIFASPEYAQSFHDNVLRGYPAINLESCADEPIETFPPTQPPASVEELFTPSSKGKSAAGSFGEEQPVYEAKKSGGSNRDRKRTSQFLSGEPHISMLQEVILRHFGRGIVNPNAMPGYMHKYVYWAPSSSCHFMFEQSKDKMISELGPGDRLAIADCIRLKMIAVSLASASPIFAWVPEDLLYNPWSAVFGLIIKLLRLAIVATQFFYDRNTEPRNLLDAHYQAKWRSLQLNVEFYNDTLLPIFKSAANETEGYRLVGQRIQNYTLLSYLKRNFPSLYIQTIEDSKNAFRDGDSLIDPLRGFLDYTYEVAKDAATGSGLNSEKLFAFRNQTFGFFFNYTASAGAENLPYYKRPVFVHYQGQYWDYNNRTHLLLGLGPEVVRAMDSYRSTKSLYNIFTRTVELVTSFVERVTRNDTNAGPTNDTNTWYDYVPPISRRRDGLPIEMQGHVEGFASATSTLMSTVAATPSALFSNGSKLIESIQRGMLERLESIYSSPAYETELTPAAAMVASFMSAIHKLSGANNSKILPPWCVAKAARAHNMTFAQIRQNITVADCPYYANIGFRDNKMYNEATRELYERTASGDLMLKRGVRLPPEKTFMEKYFAPMNAQAVYNRQALWKLGESVLSELWGYSYIFMGDKGTAMDRFIEVALDVHPSFSNYKADHDIYKQVMDLLPAKRATELKQRGHIKFDDHDVFDAWERTAGSQWIFNVTSKFREAALIHEAIHNEQFLRATPFWRESMDAYRATRNKIKGSKDGLFFKEITEQIKTAKTALHMSRLGRLRSNQGNNMTIYDRFSELDVSDLSGAHAMQFGINISELFLMECQSSQQWLCEECFALDIILGQIIRTVNYAVTYYTVQMPAMVEGQIAIIQYYTLLGNNSFPGIPPAYIGNNRTSQPRFPNLGEDIGVMLQFTENETIDGLDPFKWLYPIIGVTIDGLVQNGSLYNYMYNYNTAEQAESSPTSDTFIGILRIIQLDLGWDICGLIDTIQYIIANCTPAIGNWIVNHIALCNFESAVDCSARVYSFSGGIIVFGGWVSVIIVASGVALYSFGAVYMTFVISVVSAIVPAFLILVYDWSLACSPIVPMCVFQDILNLWVYTPIISGPCSIVIGTFVNDTSYGSTNCAGASADTTSFANGAAMGFTNPLNTLQFATQAYNTSYGLGDWIAPAWGFLFGQSTPTFTYADYHTNEIRTSNYTGFFIVSVATYGFLAAFIVYVAGVFVFSFLSSVGPLLQAILVGFFAFLKFLRSIQ